MIPMSSQPQLLQIALNPGDVVYPPNWVVRDMVDFFKPSGRILEPSAGDGVFFRNTSHRNGVVRDCEGTGFVSWRERVDWIVGNPPYKVFNAWLRHSFNLADNILYIFPLNRFYNDFGMLKDIYQYGGIPTVRNSSNGPRRKSIFSDGLCRWFCPLSTGLHGRHVHDLYSQV